MRDESEIMKNKYNMTKEDNIFFAKRKLIDNLYKSANLEGIAVTKGFKRCLGICIKHYRWKTYNRLHKKDSFSNM